MTFLHVWSGPSLRHAWWAVSAYLYLGGLTVAKARITVRKYGGDDRLSWADPGELPRMADINRRRIVGSRANMHRSAAGAGA